MSENTTTPPKREEKRGGLTARDILHQIQKGTISSNGIRYHLGKVKGFEDIAKEKHTVGSEKEADWLVRLVDKLKIEG